MKLKQADLTKRGRGARDYVWGPFRLGSIKCRAVLLDVLVQ